MTSAGRKSMISMTTLPSSTLSAATSKISTNPNFCHDDDDGAGGDDAHHDHDGSGRISDLEASFSIMKAVMGAGSFALPWSFSMMGYIAGPFFLAVILIMSVHSMKLLVQCARGIAISSNGDRCSRTVPMQNDSGYDVQEEDEMTPMSSNAAPTNVLSRLQTGGQKERRRRQHSYVDVAEDSFGTMGGRLAYGSSFSASVGVCGSYLVFIAENLKSLLGSTGNNLSTTIVIWLVLPAAIALSSIREMKHFAFSSMLGDVSVILGMMVVLIYGFLVTTNEAGMVDDTNSHRSFGGGCVAVGRSWDTMALAFGSIGYLFLIHFLILPIESSMVQPQNFDAVVDRTLLLCAFLSGSFGVIGYMMFGDETEQIVLLNVKGSTFVSVVKLLLCVDLLLTYPVVMRPSIVIAEQCLIQGRSHQQCCRGLGSQTTSYCRNNALLIVVCSLLGGLAASAASFVPAFGLLSGLVGGVSQTFLSFVLPPLMMAVQRRRCRRRMDMNMDMNANRRGSDCDHGDDYDYKDDNLAPRDSQEHQTQSRRGWINDLGDLFCQYLSWKEKNIVLSGLILIAWTIHSAISGMT